MATLTIPDKHITLDNAAEIREYLAQRGILFEQWEASHEFSKEAGQDEILEAYAHVLKPYMAKHGYQTADVISVHPETPNLPEIRAKFLREHTHTEDEVRFFVGGQGYFWFNLEGEEPVFCVKCVAGDLLSVPANFKHWFDLGPVAFVKTIRVFTDASGWTPHYTDSGVDARYQEAVVG
ncbi:MAG: Acireductone dioxygenase [Vampirovibrio sp.]|jgi:1,2-dihydroxy-3-keto-5-methylthiopentene dioxygenase|nr:Acireductone dioxygenase [Vampirovibrio sp.]